MATVVSCRAARDARPEAGTTLAITHVNVVDVAGRADADRTVLVAGDRIARIGGAREVEVPAGARVLDATGRWLIPGLWDMHVHTSLPDRDLPLYLANGVLGVRDMGGEARENPAQTPGTFSVAWDALRTTRDAIAAGRARGPRLYAAGVMLDAPKPWPGTRGVADAEAARRTVRSLLDEHVDFVKVGSGVTPEVFAALADEAKRKGLPLAGHVPRGMTALAVSESGQVSIEHLTGLPGGCFADAGPDATCTSTLRQLAATPVWSVPTLVAWRGRLLGLDADAKTRLDYVPQLAQRWAADAPESDPKTLESNRRAFAQFSRVVGAMRDAGGRILAGSDCANRYVVPGFALHDELRLLVEAGLTPAEALASATASPARFFGRDDVGTIAAGQRADLVLLEGDPLADIRYTSRISAVILGGQLLHRAALDEQLKIAMQAR